MYYIGTIFFSVKFGIQFDLRKHNEMVFDVKLNKYYLKIVVMPTLYLILENKYYLQILGSLRSHTLYYITI